ncbi:MAG: hypothetical protein ACD_19C00139G0002 [uncultured bacterium]|nr:MAG: hypothetical protein ACD_19C00139G0002 [uncultured bacterium]
MSEATNALIKKLEALSNQLGDRQNDFPLWRNTIEAMASLMNHVNIGYLHKPTEEQIASANEYPNKIERLKKYLKNHPMGDKEKESLIYGTN